MQNKRQDGTGNSQSEREDSISQIAHNNRDTRDVKILCTVNMSSHINGQIEI